MILALSSLFLLLQAGAAQQSFEQIVKAADSARAGDRLVEAIQLYRQAVRLRPSWSQGWWSLGSIFYDQDHFPEAQEAFKRFIATSKTDAAPVYAFLGLCEYETRDYKQATEHFDLWVKKGLPGNTQLIDVASYHWALLLTREGNFVQALFLLEEKAKKYGVSPQLAEAMGLASLRMKYVPEEYPPAKREIIWLAGQASVYGSLHDFERAHEFASRLSAHYGAEPNVHYLHGMIYSFEQKSAEAAEEFKRELEVTPDHAQAMIQLAFLALEDARVDDALPLAKKAAFLEPKDALAHYALGRVLLAAEDFQKGASEFELAKELAPASAKVRYQLARAYRRLGRNQDAERESAAFESLKDKVEVLAAPEEKSKESPEKKTK